MSASEAKRPTELTMILDEKHECMPRGDLQALQLERLKALAAKVYAKVPYYTSRMDAAGVKPSGIRSLDDLAKLPFTSKLDLRDNYPLGLLAVPKSEIREIHASSGTTGKPIIVAYTRRTSTSGARSWRGLSRRRAARRATSSRTPTATASSPAASACTTAAERSARRSSPCPAATPSARSCSSRTSAPRAICCTPSYFLSLIEAARRDGRGLPRHCTSASASSARSPGPRTMRREIEKRLPASRAIDIYGLTEIIGPGVASECACQNGLHINEDHFLPEIIDPETGKAAAPTARRRAGVHHPHQGRHCRCSATARATSRAITREHMRLRPDHRAHEPRHRPHRRHAHHPRRQRLPLADRERPHGRRRRRAALPDHRDPREARSTTWRCGSRFPSGSSPMRSAASKSSSTR